MPRTGAERVMVVEAVGPVRFEAVPEHRAFGSLEVESIFNVNQPAAASPRR